MELLLNLVWLLCTAGIFLAWAARDCSTTERRRVWAGALTLMCVALLLFPIISMTDDLSPTLRFAEENCAGKHLLSGTSAHAAPTQHTPPALPEVSAGGSIHSPAWTQLLPAPHSRHAHSPASHASVIDRAPPLA